MQQVIYYECFKPACHNTSSQILKDKSNSFGLANIACLLCYQVCSFCLEQNLAGILIALKLSFFLVLVLQKREFKRLGPPEIKNLPYSKAGHLCTGPNPPISGTRLHFSFSL